MSFVSSSLAFKVLFKSSRLYSTSVITRPILDSAATRALRIVKPEHSLGLATLLNNKKLSSRSSRETWRNYWYNAFRALQKSIFDVDCLTFGQRYHLITICDGYLSSVSDKRTFPEKFGCILDQTEEMSVAFKRTLKTLGNMSCAVDHTRSIDASLRTVQSYLRKGLVLNSIGGRQPCQETVDKLIDTLGCAPFLLRQYGERRQLSPARNDHLKRQVEKISKAIMKLHESPVASRSRQIRIIARKIQDVFEFIESQ